MEQNGIHDASELSSSDEEIHSTGGHSQGLISNRRSVRPIHTNLLYFVLFYCVNCNCANWSVQEPATVEHNKVEVEVCVCVGVCVCMCVCMYVCPTSAIKWDVMALV